ncbi:MAG: hypothetical protein J5689_00770 [Clostridia bacterium]|nr:hypothetical protein [Clostridia bacterium]
MDQQNSSWIKQTYAISVHDLINKRREYETNQELTGDGSYQKRLQDFIAKRDALIEAENPKLESRREKLRIAALRKQEEQMLSKRVI